MVGLLDIAPSVATVKVRGHDVSVPGISLAGVASLISRFPALRSLLSGETVEAQQLIDMGGEIAAAIIAAGCGYPGDPKAEAVAASHGLSVQVSLLEAILKETLPDGPGPFVEALTRMGGLLNLGGGEETVIKLRARPSPIASAG